MPPHHAPSKQDASMTCRQELLAAQMLAHQGSAALSPRY
jgi:hypothetical protein